MNAHLDTDSRSLLASLQADFNRQFGALKPPVSPRKYSERMDVLEETAALEAYRQVHLPAACIRAWYDNTSVLRALSDLADSDPAALLHAIRSNDDCELGHVLRLSLTPFIHAQAEDSVERAFYGDKP